MRLFKQKTNINFLGQSRRKIALALSALVVIASIVSLATHEPPLEFGIDFTGGILLEVGYPEAADLPSIRSGLAAAGFDDALVQRFGADTDVLVRLPPQEGIDPDDLREQLRATVSAGTDGVELRRVEFVSPQVGKELTERGSLAMIIALLLIFVYVMIRFSGSLQPAPLRHWPMMSSLRSGFSRFSAFRSTSPSSQLYWPSSVTR